MTTAASRHWLPILLISAALIRILAVPVFSAPAWAADSYCSYDADAAALANSRTSIDSACPCAAAATRGSYRSCATATVRGLIAAAQLPKVCRREAMLYARQSLCGRRSGAVVCCRAVEGEEGWTSHRVMSDASKCVDADPFTACVSPWQSIVSGCDGSGCVAPVCANGVVEAGEECDPPDGATCDGFCQAIDCYDVPAACGNAVVDVGEACEPPGIADCGADCQLAPCAPAGPGEIDVACVTEAISGEVTLAASAAGYLAAWTGPQRRPNQVVARRYDVNADPLDAALTVASVGLPCGRQNSSPSAASNGSDFYLLWSTRVPFPSMSYTAIYGRRIGAVSGQQSLDQLAFEEWYGTPSESVYGPTMAAGAFSSRFAVGWGRANMDYYPVWTTSDPFGALLDFAASPVQTDVMFGYRQAAPLTWFSVSEGSVASLASDTLWVWHAAYADGGGFVSQYDVAAAWTDASSGTTSAPLVLTNHKPFIGGPWIYGRRPSVAAGTAALLVAWTQGATDDATTLTEIRAVRATRALGALDPDGGLLLATAATEITGGPVVTFDGARWLVVWAEASGATNDLRAVALEADGSVVDDLPRLVAADVAGQEPAAASSGDGRALVLFARADGASSALRAVLITP